MKNNFYRFYKWPTGISVWYLAVGFRVIFICCILQFNARLLHTYENAANCCYNFNISSCYRNFLILIIILTLVYVGISNAEMDKLRVIFIIIQNINYLTRRKNSSREWWRWWLWSILRHGCAVSRRLHSEVLYYRRPHRSTVRGTGFQSTY